MKRLLPVVALALLPLLGASPLQAQRRRLEELHLGDTTVVHVIRLRDGSQLVGHVTTLTKDSVQVELRSGRVTVAREDIVEAQEMPRSQVKNGELWFPNPHSTRLLFSPSAIPLEKGTGYFSNIYLFFVSVQYGFTDRFSLGAGMSVFPLDNFADNLIYLTPKFTLFDAPRLKLSLGGFLGAAGMASNTFSDNGSDGNSLGILYGVASTGTRESNLSLGLGWGYFGSQMADRPIVMIGGQGRVAKRISLITENWIVPTNQRTEGIISYGVRFLGERISVDLAFLNGLAEDKIFPGIPFVGFAIRY
jgi:hypothetical protein